MRLYGGKLCTGAGSEIRMRAHEIVVVLCALLILSQGAPAQAPDLDHMDLVLRSVPDGPVARVSDTPIPRRDFLDLYKSELARVSRRQGSSQAVPEGARVQLALWCVGTLIEHELLHQIALERGLSVPASDIEARWQREFKQMRLKISPTSTKPLSEAQVLDELGYASREEVVAKVERSMLVQKAREQIITEGSIEISEEDVREIYNQEHDYFSRPDVIHLRQIFVRVRPGQGEMARRRRGDARRRAEDALARIDSGQSFDSLVRSVSDAPGSKAGGDLGPAPVETLPPFLVEPALTMSPGEISAIIESEFGYHIIELIDLVPGNDIGYAEASAEIRRRLHQQKSDQYVREYCGEIIDHEIKVKVYLEIEKTLSTNPVYRELRAQ